MPDNLTHLPHLVEKMSEFSPKCHAFTQAAIEINAFASQKVEAFFSVSSYKSVFSNLLSWTLCQIHREMRMKILKPFYKESTWSEKAVKKECYERASFLFLK